MDSDDDIPVIPDIDDIQDDLLTLQEIKTPKYVFLLDLLIAELILCLLQFNN